MAWAAAACGDDAQPSPADGGTPLDAPSCDPATVPPLATGDADGHPRPLEAGAGQARAGRITADQLPPDPGDLAVWRPGDFVLANEHVAVVIEDVGESDHYSPWGGGLVGIARVEGGRLVAPAEFLEAIVTLGRFTVAATSVTVMEDGSDGGPARVRAAGPLRAVPFIADFARPLAPRSYDDLEAAIDYVLAPGARAVEVRVTVRNTRSVEVNVDRPFYFLAQESRMPMATPVRGFGTPEANSRIGQAAFVVDGATSYAWRAARGELTAFLSVSGVSVLLGERFSAAGCAQTAHDSARVLVGAHDGLDGVVRSAAELDGVATRAVTGVVRDGTGAPAAGAHVHLEGPDGAAYLSRAITDADGRYTLTLARGAAARVIAYRRGEGASDAAPIAAGDADVHADLALPAFGTVEVAATDAADGAPLPARVHVVPRTPVPEPPAAWGERRPGPAGVLHVAYPVDGRVALRVPPGAHRVLVARGYEYDLVERDVDVGAGGSVRVDAALERVVDTTGVMCGDFHIHTTRSPDAVDDGATKVRAGVADGLEIPVRTDHEWVRDFEPEIEALGLRAHAYGVGGMELTTFAWGHFNVFPLDRDPARINDGFIDWYDRLPPAVFADARARVGRHGPATVIINHPRSGGAFGGYFEAAGYNPATGVAARADMWDEAFSLVEVFNDSDFDENERGTVRDWFSFLSRGRRVYAVGASDSHRLSSSPLGYPRTCIEVGTDSAEALRALGAGHVRDRLQAGRATVSGGIYVAPVARGAGGAVGPGGEVTGAGAREAVRVRVWAAPWISATRLRVYVDGALTEAVPLDGPRPDPSRPALRFDADLEVPVGVGTSWAVFVADGEDDLAPVHPGRRPFGVSNPIFFRR
jgi:hypothetical protein